MNTNLLFEIDFIIYKKMVLMKKSMDLMARALLSKKSKKIKN